MNNSTSCMKPPAGWRCTRGNDHDGPCAAIEVKAQIDADELSAKRKMAHKALSCLYWATEVSIAKDVNQEVRAAFEEQDAELRALREVAIASERYRCINQRLDDAHVALAETKKTTGQ